MGQNGAQNAKRTMMDFGVESAQLAHSNLITLTLGVKIALINLITRITLIQIQTVHTNVIKDILHNLSISNA